MKKVYSDGERYFELSDKPERTDDDNREMRTLTYIGKENITSREKLAVYAAKLESLNERVEQAETSYKEQTAEDKKVNALFERYKSNLTDDYIKIFEQVREERMEAERLRREMMEEKGYEGYYTR
jgi:archaellum component FlaC